MIVELGTNKILNECFGECILAIKHDLNIIDKKTRGAGSIDLQHAKRTVDKIAAPYYYQANLEEICNTVKKTRDKLLKHFGNSIIYFIDGRI